MMMIIKTFVPAVIITIVKKPSKTRKAAITPDNWPVMTNYADFNFDKKHMFYFVRRFRGLIK